MSLRYARPKILYEDNHLLVVFKPAGYLSQGDGSHAPDLLTYFKADLKRRYQKPGAVYLGLVHRLDRPVSGVMVLAKTSKAASRLSEQIRQGQIQKVYRARVSNPETLLEEGSLEDFLLKDARLNRTRVVPQSEMGSKYAKLTYRVCFRTPQFAEVEILLETGRAHQIRVQFASRGHALLGDQRYGKAIAGQNLALCAVQLAFEHPTTHEHLQFSVEPPETEFAKYQEDRV